MSPRRSILEELRDDGVLLLTLNRPGKLNAFDSLMHRELRDALCDAQANDRVRVVVLTGAGRAFSAGQDMAEMRPDLPVDPETHGFASFIDRLRAFDKPLLAAVNGVATGLGLTLLLHCDMVFVAESARLRCPFVALGVVPEVGSSYLLPLALGWQRAAEVLFTAGWIDAQRAVALGLALRALPDAELVPSTLARAAEIAAQPPEAVRQTKRLLLATRNPGVHAARQREDAAFAALLGSPENQEAIRAFFEKRAPDFSGSRSG